MGTAGRVRGEQTPALTSIAHVRAPCGGASVASGGSCMATISSRTRASRISPVRVCSPLRHSHAHTQSAGSERHGLSAPAHTHRKRAIARVARRHKSPQSRRDAARCWGRAVRSASMAAEYSPHWA